MKAAIYVRVSTTEQSDEGYSIPGQISLLKDYASTYKYNLVKIYQDAGISGKDIEGRPALLELLEDAKNNKFEILLIWKLSRLSRSLLDLLSIVEGLNKNNISLISYSEKFDTSTPIGKMLLQLLGSIAEFERNTIIENVKMGMSERFNQGYSKGAIPFGYTHVDKKAVINEAQAEMVKFAFNHYVNSSNPNCLQEITEYFTQKGFKTRIGRPWNRLVMRELLMNKFYAGYVRTGVLSHGRKKKNYSEIQGAHEAIVSIDVWGKANGKIMLNKNNPTIRNYNNDNFLTGLIICPKCGKKMYALNTYSNYTNKLGNYKEYTVRGYRCTYAAKGKQFCLGFTVASSKIESKVMDFILNFTDTDILIEANKRSEEEKKKLEKPIIDNLKVIAKKLLEAKTIKEKYFKIIESSKDFNPAVFASKFNEIELTINGLERQREAELLKKPNQTNVSDLKRFKNDLKEFKQLKDKLSPTDLKLAVRSFISEVRISEQRSIIDIKLTNAIVIPYLYKA